MQGHRRPLPRLMPKYCTTTHRSLPPQSCCLLLLLQTMQSTGRSSYRMTVRRCLFYSLYSRRRRLLMPLTLPRPATARRRTAQRQSKSSSTSQAGTRARWKLVDATLRIPYVSRAFPNNKNGTGSRAVHRTLSPFHFLSHHPRRATAARSTCLAAALSSTPGILTIDRPLHHEQQHQSVRPGHGEPDRNVQHSVSTDSFRLSHRGGSFGRPVHWEDSKSGRMHLWERCIIGRMDKRMRRTNKATCVTVRCCFTRQERKMGPERR
jgi:hypothetical protein